MNRTGTWNKRGSVVCRNSSLLSPSHKLWYTKHCECGVIWKPKHITFLSIYLGPVPLRSDLMRNQILSQMSSPHKHLCCCNLFIIYDKTILYLLTFVLIGLVWLCYSFLPVHVPRGWDDDWSVDLLFANLLVRKHSKKVNVSFLWQQIKHEFQSLVRAVSQSARLIDRKER